MSGYIQTSCYNNRKDTEKNKQYACSASPSCSAKPSASGRSSAHIGYEDRGKLDIMAMLQEDLLNVAQIKGATGSIPFDKVYEMEGRGITGPNPIQLLGPHTYTIAWSGSINALDSGASIRVEMLLDGNPIGGTGAYTDISKSMEGYIALAGGGIVSVEKGWHQLEMRYIAGSNGIETQDVNIRIVEIA